MRNCVNTVNTKIVSQWKTVARLYAVVRYNMFKKLLKKLDREINEDWDYCDGYGTCFRWPITGSQMVKSYKLDDCIIDSLPNINKNADELF